MKNSPKYLKLFLIIMIMGIIITLIYKPWAPKKEKWQEPRVSLYLIRQEQVIHLNLEDYLVGSVAAEMPAAFGLEALKAQAVCARTYAIRKIINGSTYPLGAELSDDINSCQAYRSQQDLHKMPIALQKQIYRAVKETRGEVMLYQGKPIDALYHSTCGGRTESAAAVWIKDCPYLQSVKCEYCWNSAHYYTVHRFSAQQINQIFGWASDGRVHVKIMDKTPSGRVKNLLVNNRMVSGESFRKLLGLPSTWFSFEMAKDGIIISNRGYGHGVGMCQYGAGGMAKAGKNYHQILNKYYQNIEFYKIPY